MATQAGVARVQEASLFHVAILAQEQEKASVERAKSMTGAAKTVLSHQLNTKNGGMWWPSFGHKLALCALIVNAR